ncbi:TerB family tellurite resistance protein [Thalassotalea litorea]|uniref:TerB family tellurite resistance protein n=1 Tax=Thalassotalea litorea TaxID=2020715 RepID=A0A5R9IVE9_9GAMM|nr:TerB family tellurite resistance protein [Thalassotalea litorea]TLU67146.1 TerB family tellurite resistance protein [Thalassotalea litorea]
MHIILGVIGSIITILILINRLSEAGLDIGWLNPFSWHRRRKYRNNHDLNPVFKLDSPMDVAALYVVGAAKADGDITATQKQAIVDMFESEFHLSNSQAKELLSSSVHLIGNGQEFYDNPDRCIERTYDDFSPEQVDSVNALLNRIIEVDGNATAEQTSFVSKVAKAFPVQSQSKW